MFHLLSDLSFFFSARLCFLSQPNKRPCVLGCWYSMTRILIRNVRGGKLREGILIFDNPIKKNEARHSCVCLRQPLLFVTELQTMLQYKYRPDTSLNHYRVCC